MTRSFKSINIIPVFLFLLVGVSNIQGQNYQNVIKGVVYDIDSGLRLPAVNVYLSNTTIGDATDTLGVYQIKNIPPGNYDLVYQFTGYEKQIISIDIGFRDTLTYKAGLKYKPYQLDSLVVKGERDRLWQRNLERFKRHFIGTSNNAEMTELVNPYVLDFEIVGFGEYTAKAQDELHIINRALGYEYFVTLDYFKWNYHDDSGQTYYYLRIKELEPKGYYQESEWKLKREVTYNHSIRKFFLGLIEKSQEKINQSAFSKLEYKGTTYNFLNGVITRLTDPKKIRQYQPPDNRYTVSGFELVINKAATGPYGMRSASPPKHPLFVYSDDLDNSVLDYYNRDADEYIFVLDPNGHLLNPMELAIGGYWAQFRLADFLPLNYRPEN